MVSNLNIQATADLWKTNVHETAKAVMEREMRVAMAAQRRSDAPVDVIVRSVNMVRFHAAVKMDFQQTMAMTRFCLLDGLCHIVVRKHEELSALFHRRAMVCRWKM
jgi:hypothetical protein